MRELCVSKMCVGKLCVSKLCVSKLCVSKLCVSKLRVGERRREAGGGTKNKNPTQRCGELFPTEISFNGRLDICLIQNIFFDDATGGIEML